MCLNTTKRVQAKWQFLRIINDEGIIHWIMKAIILAAGIGSRLKPLTDFKPKTMVEINGKPMLRHILDAVFAAGVTDVVICTGYKSEVIRDYCSKELASANIRFIENHDYQTTNNMYSLFLASAELRGDCLLMNADLCFDPQIIEMLMKQTETAFAIDKGRF